MLTGHSAPANPLGFVDPLGRGCWVAVGQWIRAAGLAVVHCSWAALIPWRGLDPSARAFWWPA